MANWNDPVLTTPYVQFLADLKARDSDLAKMFDSGTPTNVETDSVRFNKTASRFERWDGAGWVELDPLYLINVDKLGGLTSAGYTLIAHTGAGGGAHADVTQSVDGFMTAADKTKLDNATAAATANELVDRDASGRAKVANPSATTDIANKTYVDNNPIASTTVAGHVERATDAEASAGTDTTRYITPKHLGDNLSVPAGTVMLFFQAAAPTGWTQVTSQNNKAFRVVSGAGGGVAGATGFTTVFGSGKVTGNKTLAIADIPSHTHTSPYIQNSSGALASESGSTGTGPATGPTGGGGAHNHTLSLDLQYINIILASKN